MRTIIEYNIQRKLINGLIKKLKLILGTRGGNLNAGLVYAPYIPAQLEPVMIDNQINSNIVFPGLPNSPIGLPVGSVWRDVNNTLRIV